MQLGTIILAGVCGVVGLVAGRASAPAPPIVLAGMPVAPRVAPVIVGQPVAATPDPEPASESDNNDDDGEGTDVAAVLATLNAQAAARPSSEAVVGQVTDWHNDPAVAATVVATGPNLEGERVVLTDEHGGYQIVGLPPGFYTITIYYLDRTFTLTDIASREVEATDLDIALSAPTPRADDVARVVEPEQANAVLDENIAMGITFSGSDVIEGSFGFQ